jgi:hypothetical protein
VGSSDLDSPINRPGSNNSQGGRCPLRKGCSGNGGGPSLNSGWDDTGCPEDDSGVLDDWDDIVDTLSVDDGCHQSPDPIVLPMPQTNATPAKIVLNY